jgi:hypothetical protein
MLDDPAYHIKVAGANIRPRSGDEPSRFLETPLFKPVPGGGAEV